MAYTTISSHTGGNLWPSEYGTAGMLGIFCTRDFVADDGKSFQQGNADSLTNQFVTTATITVAANIPTYGSFTLPKTDIASPITVRYVGVIFDSNGVARDFLFTNFDLVSSLGDSITYLGWWNDNQQHRRYPVDTVPTTTQMNLAIAAAITAPATTTRNGLVEISVSPIDSAHPIAVGDNDPRNTDSRTPTVNTPLTITLPYDGDGSVLANRVVKVVNSLAALSQTTDTGGAIGIATGGGTNYVTVAIGGRASVPATSGFSVGHYLVQSDIQDGKVMSAGTTFPSSGQVIGRAANNNFDSIALVDIFGSEVRASGTNPPAGALYWAINYSSFAAAVTAMGTTVPVRLIVSEQMAVAVDVTVTPNIQLQFVGNGRLIVATNKTVTIQGSLIASPSQWIFDVSASGAAASFSGNKSIPYYFLEWWGARGDAVYGGANGTDNGPFITAAYNSVPTDGVLTSAQGEFFGIATQVSLLGMRNIALRSWNRVANYGGGAPAGFLWTGSGTGPMFALDSCQGMTIKGWYFALQPGKTVDGFIDIDGVGAPNGTISSANSVLDNSFNATSQANPNFKAVSIARTAGTNNEHMTVSRNFIGCSNYINTRISDAGSITVGTPNLTVTGLSLTSADNGKRIRVGLAGTAGATLDTTILNVTSGTTATLAANAIATVAGARVIVGQALGVGIYNGPSANALHQTFEDNNIAYAKYGIQFANGSGLVQNVQGGGNEIDVYINGSIGDGIEIVKVATEASRQAVVMSAPADSPVIMRQMRNSNNYQLTEGYYVLDGMTRLEGSSFNAPPPALGRLIASRESGNLRFTSASTDYSTSIAFSVTMALSGFTAILNNGTGDLIDIQGARGITDAPAFNFTNSTLSNSALSSAVAVSGSSSTLQVSSSGGPYADLVGLRGIISNNPVSSASRIIVGVSGEIAAGSGNPSGTATIGVRSKFPASLANGGGAADAFGFQLVVPTTSMGNHRDAYGMYIPPWVTTNLTGKSYGIYQAGVADINVLLGTLQLNGILFANLPASPIAGMVRTVTDSNTVVWGATIAGGGANTVLAFFDGTNWTVFAK